MLKSLNSKKILLIIICMLTSHVVRAEDLAQTYNLGVQVDPILKQAFDNRDAVLELLPQARAQLLPVIGLTANTTYNNTKNPISGAYNTFLYGATLSQPLFNLASWFQYQQTDDQIKSAVATLEDNKLDLMLRVTTQYFTILKALDDLIFARSERKAFARHLEETKQKFSAGVIAITDVNSAQAKFDSAHAQEISAENELSNQLEIMGQITGQPAKAPSILKYDVVLHNPHPNDIEHWVNMGKQHNFDLISKRADERSAQKNINIQKAGHYPTVIASGQSNVSRTAPPPPETFSSNTIGVTLTIPLFNSGSINSKVRQARAQYEQAKQKRVAAELQVISNIRQAFRGIVTQINQVKALQQSVISGKSALDATQAAFEVGTRTIVDVLNAQSDLLKAQSDLSKARYDYIINSFKLKRYSGLLQVEDINTINSWLQPAPKGMYKRAADNG